MRSCCALPREILERQLNPNPTPRTAAWGGAATTTKAAQQLSMREIMMFEESAADLEGGDMDEDLSEYLPQQPVAPAARVSKNSISNLLVVVVCCYVVL